MIGKRKPVIAILTDFGPRNWYASTLKGVILGICPDATIVDLCHDVPPQQIEAGAYILAFVSKYYPEGTVFLCVVDPGVDTSRELVALETEANHIYVAADNGLLTLVADREGVRKIVKILNRRFMLPDISHTFHGRDILAPVAAHLANGEVLENFGPLKEGIMKLEIEEPVVEEGKIKGKVILVDDFGNAVTNIEASMLNRIGVKVGSRITVTVGSLKAEIPFFETYADIGVGEPLILIGSNGFLELSVNRRNAAKRYKVYSGSKIELCRNRL